MAGGVVDIQVRPQTRGFSQAVERDVRSGLSGALSRAASLLKPVAIGAGALLAGGITTGIKGIAQKQGALISLETLLGSKATAQKVFDDIAAMAKKTPFEIAGLTDGAVKLAGVGVAAGDLLPTLAALGDLTAAVGGTQDDYNGILLAYSQSLSKGKIYSEEMMQMQERGIPAWQIMAKATGKSVEELQGLAKEGKLLTDDVLPSFLDQINKDYGGAMQRQSGTLTGIWSNIKDGIVQATMEGLAPFEGDITRIGQWMADRLPALAAAGTRKVAESIKATALAARELWEGFHADPEAELGWFGTLGQRIRGVVDEILKNARDLGAEVKPLWDAIVLVLSDARTRVDGPLGALTALFGLAYGSFRALLPVIGSVSDVFAGMLRVFVDLPGPVQAGILAILAYRQLQGSIGWFPRLRQGIRELGELADMQRHLADRSGQGVGAWGAYMGAIQSKFPWIGRAAQAFRGAVGDNDRFIASLGTARQQWGAMNTLQGGGFTSMVRSSMTAAGTAIRGFATTASGFGAAGFSAIRSGASGLMNFMGGPWGLAFAGAGVVLGIFASEMDQRAQAFQRAKDNARGMAEAITEAGSAGEVSLAQLTAQNDGLAEFSKVLKESGTSLDVFMQAAAGNQDAVQAILDAVQRAMDDFDVSRATELLDTLDLTREQLELLNEAKEEAAQESAKTSQAEKDLKAAIKTLGDDAASATAKVDALRAAIDILNGGTKSQTQAAIDAAKAQAQLSQINADLAEKGGAVAAGAIDAAGAINTQTQAGWDLYDALDGVAKNATEQVIAQYQAEKATLGQAKAADNAAATMKTLRDQFIASAQASGLSAEAAAALADELGLVPNKVDILLTLEGNTKAQEEAQKVIVALASAQAQGEKSIKMKIENAEAIAALEAAGYKLKDLGNGEYEITLGVDTTPADQAVDATVGGIGGMAPRMNLHANTEPADAAADRSEARTKSKKPWWQITADTSKADGEADRSEARTSGKKPGWWVWADTSKADGEADRSEARTSGKKPGWWVWADTSKADGEADRSEARTSGKKPFWFVSADTKPADAAAESSRVRISGIKPIMAIQGNAAPATSAAGQLGRAIAAMSAVLPIRGDSNGVRVTTGQARTWVATQAGVLPIRGDSNGVRVTTGQARGWVGTQAGVLPIRGDSNGVRVATGQARAWVGTQSAAMYIGASTTGARDQVITFLRWASSQSATVNVRSSRMMAAGGVNEYRPTHFFATGGFMDAATAQVVPAGSLRVIGDNPNSRESFIPWDDTARSFAIWLSTAAAFPSQLAAAAKAIGGAGAQPAGPQQVNNIYYPVAERTSTVTRRLAQSISREASLV